MEHKIFIDVSEFDEEKKKRVQDAFFFKLGYKWLLGGYRHLSTRAYTTVRSDGDCWNDTLMFSDFTASENQQPYVKSYDELMEIAGMAENVEESPNTFTKSMLVSGEHVVETREGRRYLIAGGMLINLSGYEPLGGYEDNLEFKNIPKMSIDKIYSGRDRSCEGCLTEDIKEYHAGEGFKDYINQENLTLIWQRETPEEEAKRIRKQELEEKVVALKQELKQAENELQEL